MLSYANILLGLCNGCEASIINVRSVFVVKGLCRRERGVVIKKIKTNIYISFHYTWSQKHGVAISGGYIDRKIYNNEGVFLRYL